MGMGAKRDEGGIRTVGAWLRRLFDARRERRRGPGANRSASLSLRGKSHDVRILDLSESGAMIAFDGHGREGDPVTIQLLDHGLVAGQLRWIRDGKAGIFFTRPLPGDPK